jgi:hypothetical protein
MDDRQARTGLLRVAAKGEKSGGFDLTREEDSVLRAAFGRFGGQSKARAAAAAVVARYQQMNAGMWFLCSCLANAMDSPALVPRCILSRDSQEFWVCLNFRASYGFFELITFGKYCRIWRRVSR